MVGTFASILVFTMLKEGIEVIYSSKMSGHLQAQLGQRTEQQDNFSLR